jgi:SAM-dependent methyltransferase
MSENYNAVHSRRFEESLRWITPLAQKAERVLELGGPSIFTDMFGALWPGKLVAHYGGDLREGFRLNAPHELPLDLILCMEVIEHLHDRESKEVSTQWTGSGVHRLLKSCAMALRDGGSLFLTTPNPCSITAIHHALSLGPGMIYLPHVREYPPYQLDEMLRNAGFEVVRRETLDVWRNAISDAQHENIRRFIQATDYPDDLRGEDIFVIALKDWSNG